MKLIPARCPSCGADIEVNKSNETTKCKYCETRIFIDDAIAKYKVEIQNMPTTNSYLKIGTRNLNSRNFIKAHEQLEKALEIEPDNAEIIIKETLSEVLQKEITENNFNQILSSFRDAKEFGSEEKIDELIIYTMELFEQERTKIMNIVHSSPRKEIFTKMLYKLIFYIHFYERLFRNYAFGIETKKQIIYKLLSTIYSYQSSNCYSDINPNGLVSLYVYNIPMDMLNLLNSKQTMYRNELMKLNNQ